MSHWLHAWLVMSLVFPLLLIAAGDPLGTVHTPPWLQFRLIFGAGTHLQELTKAGVFIPIAQMHMHGIAVGCAHRDIEKLFARLLARGEFEQLPNRRFSARGIVKGIASRPFIDVPTRLREWFCARAILVKRKILH